MNRTIQVASVYANFQTTIISYRPPNPRGISFPEEDGANGELQTGRRDLLGEWLKGQVQVSLHRSHADKL